MRKQNFQALKRMQKQIILFLGELFTQWWK